MNLFLSFDPNVMGVQIKFISTFFTLLLLVPMFWAALNSPISTISKMVIDFIKGELKNSMISFHTLIFSSMFILIANANLFGLCPGTYTPSTHPVFATTLALPMWLSMMMYTLTKQPIFTLAHFLPKGTPLVLQPFMVLIELTSNVIRPLTLTVRLTANLLAGHLIMILMVKEAPLFSWGGWVLMGLLPMACLIAILEFNVALIQAYVFSVLSTLYLKEFDSMKLNKI